MQLGIAGRRALVAGSSSGIGASIAVALAAEGARVVIHGRDRERAESVAATIRKASGEAAIVCGDLGDPAAVDAVGHGALAAFGGIDILVNSAGASDHFDPWLDTSVTTWQKQYQLSTLYAVRLIQMMVPTMRGAGWGASSTSVAPWSISPARSRRITRQRKPPCMWLRPVLPARSALKASPSTPCVPARYSLPIRKL